jgi:hypothetical protein
MFVVTVVSFDNETTSKVFGLIADARKWAASGALSEFEGDVAGITLHEADSENARLAIEEVKAGRSKFIEAKARPMTTEQAERAVKAEAIRFLASLGLTP